MRRARDHMGSFGNNLSLRTYHVEEDLASDDLLDAAWRGLAWGCARRTACRSSYGVAGTAAGDCIAEAGRSLRIDRFEQSKASL